ncbi:MAG: VOC family protein [Candidatus Poribacteria bacterium]|nr:VOC family protein [Candidatus Poribacteria bacterium]MDE0502774.1 VOC family protein [Candidatus Poribacteria bacterium]
MAINRIHKIALVTDDVEDAVNFYTQTLGLEVMERFPNEDDDDYVFLTAGDIILELMPQRSTGADLGFHHISFKVGSVDDGAQELKDKGVELEEEPFDAGDTGIRLSFLRGPNEVLLQLFHRTQQDENDN